MPRKPKPCYHKRLGLWYARVGEPGPDGSARAVYAPRDVRDEASAWAWLAAERERRTAETIPFDPANMTVVQVAEHYLHWAERRKDQGKLSPEHYASKAIHLGIFAEALGPRAARTLRVEDANHFLAGLATRYAVNYRANIMASVNACLNWAVRSGHLPANPILGHDPTTVPRAAPRFAEVDEAAAFLRFWLHRLPRATPAARYDRSALLLVRCLIRTGARPKELCRLRWGQVRWDAGRSSAGHAFATATLVKHKTADATGKPRVIYFPPALTRALRREHDRPDRHPEFLFVHGRGRGGKGAGEPWKDGATLAKKVRTIRRTAIAEAVRRAAAGEPTRGLEKIRDVGVNRVHNYRWRHTAISTLLRIGVDVPTIAELVGTSPELIYHTYGHLLSDHLARAAEKLFRGRES